MPSEKDNILKFNEYIKSKKNPYIIYADLESLIKRNRRYEKIFNNKNR